MRLGCASTFSETFRHNNHRFRIDLLASHPVEVLSCGFPRDDSTPPHVMPMRIFRASQQTEIWYAAVYRSGAILDEPIRCEVEPGEPGDWQVTIQLKERRFVHRVPQLQPPKALVRQ